MTHSTTTPLARWAPTVGPATRKLATPRVRNAFDPAMLADICTLDDFSRYGPKTLLDDKGRRFYHHVDNGSNVLAVAHLDTVQRNNTCSIVDTAGGLLAVSGALDDRLGAYVILELLPALGITCDWLLTTDEEVGDSTAGEVGDLGKDYNWMIQFDRGGTDVVMYDYETDALAALVEDSGARVGIGSYSDICMLEHLGCAGLNWGVGYEDYHSPRAHAWLEDTFRMVARFLRFHEANASTLLVHEPRLYYDDPSDDLDYYGPLDDDAYDAWLEARQERGLTG